MEMDAVLNDVLTPQLNYWPHRQPVNAQDMPSTVNSSKIVSVIEKPKQGTVIQTQPDELVAQHASMLTSNSQNKTNIEKEEIKRAATNIQLDLTKADPIINPLEEDLTILKPAIHKKEIIQLVERRSFTFHQAQDKDINPEQSEKRSSIASLNKASREQSEKRSSIASLNKASREQSEKRSSIASLNKASREQSEKRSSIASLNKASREQSERRSSNLSLNKASGKQSERRSSNLSLNKASGNEPWRTPDFLSRKRLSNGIAMSFIDSSVNTASRAEQPWRKSGFLSGKERSGDQSAKRSSALPVNEISGGHMNDEATTQTNIESAPPSIATVVATPVPSTNAEESQQGKDKPNKQVVDNTLKPVVSNNKEGMAVAVITILDDPYNTKFSNQSLLIRYDRNGTFKPFSFEERDSPQAKEVADKYNKLIKSRSAAGLASSVSNVRKNHSRRNSVVSAPTKPFGGARSVVSVNESGNGFDWHTRSLPRGGSKMSSMPAGLDRKLATSCTGDRGLSENREQGNPFRSNLANNENSPRMPNESAGGDTGCSRKLENGEQRYSFASNAVDFDDNASVTSSSSRASTTRLSFRMPVYQVHPFVTPLAGRNKRSLEAQIGFDMYNARPHHQSTHSVGLSSIVSRRTNRDDDFWKETESPTDLAGQDRDIEAGKALLNPLVANTKSNSRQGSRRQQLLKYLCMASGTVTGVVTSMLITTDMIIPALVELIQYYRTNGGGCV